MGKNCLVTKLKGTVNNDNLPKLGTIIIKVDTSVSMPTDYILAEAGRHGKTVVYKSNYPIHVGTATGTAKTEGVFLDITAIEANQAFLYLEEGHQYVIEISGDIYDGIWIFSPSISLIQNPTFEILGSLDFLDTPVLPIEFAINNPYAQILTSSSKDTNLKGIKDNVKSVRANASATPSQNIRIIVDEITQANKNVVNLYNTRGDIKFLPKNITIVQEANAASTGTIEEFVASRIAMGRKSGTVYYQGTSVTRSGGITYNGTSISGYILPNTSATVVFSWDAGGNVTFENAIPESIADDYRIYVEHRGYPDKPATA